MTESKVFASENPADFQKFFKGKQCLVLVDENTNKYCLPLLPFLQECQIVKIESGEIHKTLQSAQIIWDKLIEIGADRNSYLINIGGGVITDLGGFAASLYKRGIQFINIPTTLLAMVDAAFGGKNGVDYQDIKNAIGTFSPAEMVLISNAFLKTLPVEELQSGKAEMYKHLILSGEFLKSIPELGNSDYIPDLAEILTMADFKLNIVAIDPLEKGERKLLNFGHSIGHAIESWYLKNGQSVLHGEAICLGMKLETALAASLGLLNDETANLIFNFLETLEIKAVKVPSYEQLLPFLIQDKKNQNQQIKMVLPTQKGFDFNCVVETNELEKFFESISV
jgi:3-dehydroquinate synthase